MEKAPEKQCSLFRDKEDINDTHMEELVLY